MEVWYAKASVDSHNSAPGARPGFRLAVDKSAISVSDETGQVIVRDQIGLRPDDWKKYVPAILRVHRSLLLTAAPPLDLAARGWTIARKEAGAIFWKSGPWYYVSLGEEATPHTVIRVMNSRMMYRGDEVPRIVQEQGDTWVDAYGTDVFADSTFVIATRLFPDWLVEDRIAAVQRRKATGIGQPAPELSVKRWIHTANPLSLDALRGKVVLIDFWGLWCMPCVSEIPQTTNLVKKLQKSGLVTLAVHTDRESEKLDAFLRKAPFPVPIGVDTGETERLYSVNAWPTYILVDKKGQIRYRENEPPSEEFVKKLLAEPR